MADLIKKYWQQLETREKNVLTGGGVVVTLILFYAMIWQPWHKSIASMQNEVQIMRADLVWVRQHAPIITRGNNGASKNIKGADQSLLSILEVTAKQAKIDTAIKQITPNNDSEVRVVLEGVNFNNWIKWIDVLSIKYGVNVLQANAERDKVKPNIAEVRITLIR